MLVLTRKLGEAIRIGSDMEVVVLSVAKGRVKLGLSAPPHVPVHRAEVADSIKLENATSQPESAPAGLRRELAGFRTVPIAVPHL